MQYVTSRRQLLGLAGTGLALGSVSGIGSPGSGRTATVILVRHAEASKEGPDPGLVERGIARADRLAGLLQSAGITELWATELQRTQATLKPLAERLGLEVQRYGARDPGAFVREHLSGLPGGAVVLVAGHSNTVPALTAALGGTLEGLDSRGFLDETEHDRVVVLPLHSAGPDEPLTALTTLDLRLVLQGG